MSKMKRLTTILGIAGLILAICGVSSAIISSNTTWYSYFVIGGTFF